VAASSRKADYTLRIASGRVELAPETIVSTATYNGQFPVPPLRFAEGRPAVVDVHNDTGTPELLHWHGQTVPPRRRRGRRGGHPVHPHVRDAASVVHPPPGGVPRLRNASDDIHPLHLHRHTFELTHIAGCHQQLHMDHGFLILLRCT
jgi:FtsP/CotA-like multicopper oxidase with cupredoxin domain